MPVIPSLIQTVDSENGEKSDTLPRSLSFCWARKTGAITEEHLRGALPKSLSSASLGLRSCNPHEQNSNFEPASNTVVGECDQDTCRTSFCAAKDILREVQQIQQTSIAQPMLESPVWTLKPPTTTSQKSTNMTATNRSYLNLMTRGMQTCGKICTTTMISRRKSPFIL